MKLLLAAPIVSTPYELLSAKEAACQKIGVLVSRAYGASAQEEVAQPKGSEDQHCDRDADVDPPAWQHPVTKRRKMVAISDLLGVGFILQAPADLTSKR